MNIGYRLTGPRRLLAVGLTGLLALTACAPAATPAAVPTVEPTIAPTSAPTEARTEIVVTDALDREVVFAELPQRIVIAGRATTLVTDAFFLFPEAAERLVGFEQRGQSAGKFLSVIDPTFGDKTILEQNAAPEQIAAWDPDEIYIVSYNGDSDVLAAALMDDPIWQGLKATGNRQVYGFAGDFYSWDQPDPRWVLGLEWLFKWIQPELAADTDIEQAINAFYTELYGLDKAVVTEQVLVNLYGSMP